MELQNDLPVFQLLVEFDLDCYQSKKASSVAEIRSDSAKKVVNKVPRKTKYSKDSYLSNVGVSMVLRPIDVCRTCAPNLVRTAAGVPALRFSEATKRVFDVAASAALLTILAPLLIILAAIVRLDGGPAFYSHKRIGRGGRPFAILKFRSMVTDAAAHLERQLAADRALAEEWATRRKLAKDPRVTRIGRILRATSLDELPQLLNVLRGDMSLVGPRPVLVEELDIYYGPAGRAAYVSVRPGITGLWQVSGRSETSYEARVAYDIRYVEERSLIGDIRLLVLTVPSVLWQRGAA